MPQRITEQVYCSHLRKPTEMARSAGVAKTPNPAVESDWAKARSPSGDFAAASSPLGRFQRSMKRRPAPRQPPAASITRALGVNRA